MLLSFDILKDANEALMLKTHLQTDDRLSNIIISLFITTIMYR
jgi:hypothetical protein